MDDALLAKLNNAHLDDNDDIRDESGSDVSDNELDEDSTQPVGSVDEPFPLDSGRHNTGPKGVLADHAQHQRQARAARKQALNEHNARALTHALTTTTYLEDEAAARQENGDDRELIIEGLDEEQAALERYRRSRMEEMRKKVRRFGSLRQIRSDQYVESVDAEDAEVSVVVHIFDNMIPSCRLLNTCLAHLARRYSAAKFLSILADEVDFDPVGLPAVLGYRAGKLEVNLTPITDEIGEDGFDLEQVEDVLLRFGAIRESDIGEQSLYSMPSTGSGSYGRGGGDIDKEEDDDDDDV
ncbi:uncharacterized protein VTP21DRAFT_7718 [Calcarisporiella thermophila]|uniref:uncharacterized protein n=1 Tax=Calcarisporiella thermophila TaxID=911321 RepID=UPI0037435E49